MPSKASACQATLDQLSESCSSLYGKQAKLMVRKQQRERLASHRLLVGETGQNVHRSDQQSPILPATRSISASNHIAAISGPVMSPFLRTGARKSTLQVTATERARAPGTIRYRAGPGPVPVPFAGDGSDIPNWRPERDEWMRDKDEPFIDTRSRFY